MDKFAELILEWYVRHARRLPWRDHPDPYAVWVSEIMLQQTQVATVIPYFAKWMKQFPDISTLAKSNEQEILAAWEGLGYYARARNLHKAGKVVSAQYGGVVPSTAEELMKLPGVGRYTAAAIASMAFGRDEVTLDGNIKRILARVFNISTPANTSSGEKILWELAATHLPKGRAGDYNQALMDIGATICLPRNPLCSKCPINKLCSAQREGSQDELPVIRKKTKIPTKIKTAAVILRKGKVLLVLRPSKGLLGGMWEFPAAEVDTEPLPGLISAIQTSYNLKVNPVSPVTIVHHSYTHFKLTEHAFLCTLKGGSHLPENFRWIPLNELGDYPMGKVDRRIASKLSIGNG
jgi:A/G-specific adenine glycosylase